MSLAADSRIYVAGHRGLVGSAIVRALRARGHDNLVLRTHAELDLTRQADVEHFFAEQKPEYVVLAAAKVGGILANDTYPADFIRENLAIQDNVIHESWRAGVKRLLFLGSSCIYPRDCPQPIREQYLLTGPLEPTNQAYALAKIAGIEMCASYNRQHGTQFVAAMPTNLYGPGDNYDLNNSHVIPALIRKMSEAAADGRGHVELWGTGTPRREFLHSDDMAAACLTLLQAPWTSLASLPAFDRIPLLNIGSGMDMTIRELAQEVAHAVGFTGEIRWDPGKPDGTPRKLLDIARIGAVGWRPTIGFREGLHAVAAEFMRQRRNTNISASTTAGAD